MTLALVLGAHAALVWLFIGESLVLTEPLRTAPLTILSLTATRPAPKISAPLSISLSPISSVAAVQPTLGPVEEDAPTVESAQGSGRVTPPHPTGPMVDTAPFVQQAGLQKGSGATVVLRVEVRGSGAVGRVDVEVSGGSLQLDQAAIAYVRALSWVGGRISDRPETLWVRWGVRLDG